MKRIISLLLLAVMMSFIVLTAGAQRISVPQEETSATTAADIQEVILKSSPSEDEEPQQEPEPAQISEPSPQTTPEISPAPEPVPEPAPSQEEAPGPQQEQAPQADPQPQLQAQEEMPQPASVLFIGDSRCVQMRAAVGDGGCSWICENSKGYDWLESKAIGQADRIVGKGTKVVICLGVNDTDHVQKYAALVNQKAAEWAARGAVTYYVSVNPVGTNPYRTEEEVERFNATMPGLLSGVTWIDTHSILVSSGYRLVDGLHYDEEGSAHIFNLIISSLH